MDRILDWYALDTKVLVVAVKGAVNDWSAYIGAVPGKNHEEEAQGVAEEGTKVSYAIAKLIFPHLVEQFSWRA